MSKKQEQVNYILMMKTTIRNTGQFQTDKVNAESGETVKAVDWETEKSLLENGYAEIYQKLATENNESNENE